MVAAINTGYMMLSKEYWGNAIIFVATLGLLSLLVLLPFVIIGKNKP